MDRAIQIIRTFFDGEYSASSSGPALMLRVDKLDKKVLKSSYTPSKKPKIMKQTPVLKASHLAEERATIERLTPAKTLKKAPVRRPIDDDTKKERPPEGKGEAIHLATGGIPELGPRGIQHHHDGTYTGYDGGGGGDGGGGC